MCGRFTLRTPAESIYEFFEIVEPPAQLPLRYNIAPTQPVAAVRRTAKGTRELVQLRWGLVPAWADDLKVGNRMINARAETVATKPSFRSAFKRRRCLIVADGYYEWQKPAGRGTKQPYYIHYRDDRPFAFAGLWERCNKLEEPVESCTIITTESAGVSRDIHDRMPAILRPEHYELWLDPEFEGTAQLTALLGPHDDPDLIATPVRPLVNNPRHDSPECIEAMETT